MTVRVLVVAKAPVPGLAKTRLARDVGAGAAAEVAAAALLDTLAACAQAFAGQCHLALTGELARASRGAEIRDALASWEVFEQCGGSLAARLAHAHRTLADAGPGPVVQLGMDTPQVTPVVLADAAERLGRSTGVLGPAVDGGWWLLGLSEPRRATALATVPMSTPTTGPDTWAALAAAGVRLEALPTLRDVDTAQDAEVVAREAPDTRFARAWSRIAEEVA